MMFRLIFDRGMRRQTRNLCNVRSYIVHLLSISLLYNFTFANYTTKSHHHRNNNNNYSSNAAGLNTKAPALILFETFWWLYYYRTWFATCPAATPFCQTRTIDRAPPVKTHELYYKQRVKYIYFACVEMHPLVG